MCILSSETMIATCRDDVLTSYSYAVEWVETVKVFHRLNLDSSFTTYSLVCRLIHDPSRSDDIQIDHSHSFLSILFYNSQQGY
jgi:hypothetical protein